MGRGIETVVRRPQSAMAGFVERTPARTAAYVDVLSASTGLIFSARRAGR